MTSAIVLQNAKPTGRDTENLNIFVTHPDRTNRGKFILEILLEGMQRTRFATPLRALYTGGGHDA